MQESALRCETCGNSFELTRKVPWCECGGLLDLDFIPSFLTIAPEVFSFWRYVGVFPVRHPVSLGEPITPVVRLRLEGREVAAKLEYLLPTGSFKDRGAAVLISALREHGVDSFMEDSSGNAGAAMAAYAARAGLSCEIFCPSAASPSKLQQVQRTGARIHKIDGARDNTTAAVRDRLGQVFYASHNWHPLFLHGTKSMAYEIAEQYGWEPPPHIVIPTGGGAVVLGLKLGFGELVRLGRIRVVPKLHAVQAEACSPLTRSTVESRPSLAEGIMTTMPPRLSQLKSAISSVVTVTEEEILEGFRTLGRAGLNAEPTSAVVVPALKKLAIPLDEEVLVILTGSGLKSNVV